MRNRACPLCFAKTSRWLVLTRGDGLACPSCHTPLELSRPSKLLSATVGLLAAYLLVRLAGHANTNPAISWVLPLVEAVFAYACGSALTLFFLSDLVVRAQTSSAAFPQSHV
jgi:hypothetical protein